MQQNDGASTYDSISQRATDSYRKALVPFEPGTTNADTESRRQLHDFLAALYDCMYEDPSLFGMSVADDDFLENDVHGGDHNSTVVRKLNRPRKKIAATVELLRGFGEYGQPENGNLLIPIPEYREMLSTMPKVLAKCIAGLGEVGLVVSENADSAAIGSERFPDMMKALAELALAQTTEGDKELRHIHFARCDFNSLDEDYQLDVEEIFSYFRPGARKHAMALHSFLLEMGYTTTVKAKDFGIHEWELDYQGPRKIKSSQLVRIRYCDRYHDPEHVWVMPAAAARLVPHFPDQPERVQDDFRDRVNACDPNCSWCESKKGLGPAELEGRTICWYTSVRPKAINDESMALVRDYVRWHEALA